MDIIFGNVFDLGAFLYLTGLLAAGLFFARQAITDIRAGRFDGIAYAALALFFIAVHVVFLFIGKPADTLFNFASRLNMVSWLVLLFAPALVAIYILFGFYRFIAKNLHDGFALLFFGVTLPLFLYLIGPGWPVGMKAFLTVFYSGVWLVIEIRAAQEVD